MNTQEIEKVLSWLKSTDLIEISFRQGAKGFSLATSEPQTAPHYPSVASRFTPICSPTVGIFQWSEPGRPRLAEEGIVVPAGQKLGIIETGKGKFIPVTAANPGRLARVMVDAGAAVEFGQPLFFLEAAS